MTFLPIVQRELRAGSRRKSTFRVRWWAALIALGMTLVASVFSLSGGPRGAGQGLFTVLTWYALFLAAVSGALLTADALAQEKREGTLGLLFLTDLKGYDIIFGKFLAHSLAAFFALLAILPATSMPLLLGGVEGGEFVRRALSLLNVMFVSLAAGIFVSALSRQPEHAFANGVGLVLLLVVVLPLLSAGFKLVGAPPGWHKIGWLSPFYPFANSSGLRYGADPQGFWWALGTTHLLAWCFLILASIVLPRVFQDKPGRPASSKRASPQTARVRTASRELLSKNPVLWLRASELSTPWLAWLLVALWAVVAFCIPVFVGRPDAYWYQVESARPFLYVLKFLFAVHVYRFFAESRRNGALELLLCTPLTNDDIIKGQMRALFRVYGRPIVALIVLAFLPVVFNALTGVFNPGSRPMTMVGGSGAMAAVLAIRTAADVIAIMWLGTALAITSPRPSLVPVWTVLIVLVLPLPLVFCWMDILVDLCVISWANNKCRVDLRRLVAGAPYDRPRLT